MPLEALLRQLPHSLNESPSRIVVAFSGGLDSSALLHALKQVHGERVHALHIHHGLQSEADAWALHCSSVCQARSIPIQVLRVQVAEDGRGMEAAAREARHGAFASQLDAGDILALAHHQDDQAETFLLRALRGSGPDGLSAMSAWQMRGDAWHWRPWLNVPRVELEEYARQHSLKWIEDPSNTELRFDRNYLRHSVMPLLRDRWPHVASAFARSAELQSETRAQRTDSAQRHLDACLLPAGDLRLDALMRYGVEDRAGVLRAWVSALGLPALGGEHLQHIERDVLASRHDAEPVFTWANARIVRWRDVLHAALQTPAVQFTQDTWDGSRPLTLPEGRRWRLAPEGRFPVAYEVVRRSGGERIQLPGRRHRTEVKKLLQALGVPVWQRAHLALLIDDLGEVHAIPGLAVSDSLAKWLEQSGHALIYEADIDPAALD